MGTATFTNNDPEDRALVIFGGGRKLAFGTIAFSTSYATNGDSIDYSAVAKMDKVYEVICTSTDGVYLFVPDLANDKLKAYTALSTEVANAFDLDAVSATCDVIIIGR